MSRAIELYARRRAGFEDRVAHAAELLRQAAERHSGHIVFTTSLGGAPAAAGSPGFSTPQPLSWNAPVRGLW